MEKTTPHSRLHAFFVPSGILKAASVWRADVTINVWLMELLLELEGGKVQDKTWSRREIQSGSAYFEKLFARQIACSSPFTRLLFDFAFT